MNVQAILDAFKAHQWVVFGALIVGGIVALAKQGWLSTWIQTHLPKQYLPYVAVVLGVLGVFSVEIQQGKTFQQAFIDAITTGFMAGVASVFGHQTLIEHAMKGKEIVPAAPWTKKPAPPADKAADNVPPAPPAPPA
jgi:hypothetical protein